VQLKIQEGQTVYVSGLVDKSKEYQGYITFDKDTEKQVFSLTIPIKLKRKHNLKRKVNPLLSILKVNQRGD
jgi:hypothetical protein